MIRLMKRADVLLVLLTALMAAMTSTPRRAQAQTAGEAVAVSPAKAYRLVLEKFTARGQDLVVTVFVRDGKPAHAYAQVPAVDQTLHRVDLTPAAPIEYVLDGKRFDPPENLKSSYDYKNPEFLKYREMSAAGKLLMRNHDAPPALTLTDAAGAGTFDVFLAAPDYLKRDRFRITVDLKASAAALVGTYKAHDYHEKDEDFRPWHGAFEGKASAREMPEYWQHSDDRAFAKGADWPQQHGPTLTGSAIDCERELIDNIADARLLWVADVPIPGGRGGIPRSPFGFFPINNSGLGMTQFSAPIVANGKVYLAIPYADQSVVDSVPGLKNDPRVIRGVDPRALADEVGLMQDTLFCFDAQTGRTLWIYQDLRRSGLVGKSKSGRALTAVYHDGKVIFRGQASLYCVDAETGKLRWKLDGEPGKKGVNAGYSFRDAQAWSTDHSPVVIDGVLLVRIDDTPDVPKGAPPNGLVKNSSLVAIDPDTGKLLWRASNIIGSDAIPISIVLGGKTYVVTAYDGLVDPKKLPPGQAKPEHRGMLSLIEPKTGKIVWRKPVAGPMANYPVVWEDIVAVNVERERTVMDDKGKPVPVRYWGALRVGLDDAQLLWKNPTIDWQDGRATPLAHHGVFINDSRKSGFQAIDVNTGRIVGQYPHIYTMAYGSHNWTWAIASNDRIFTSGQYMLMFRLKDGKMELMPGRLPVDLASGYICPIRPAIADGRLFVRTDDGLACYDLRKPADKRKVDSLYLSISDLALGMAGKGNVDVQIRMVNGEPDAMVVRFPEFDNTGVARPYAWGGTNAMRWRSSGIPEFKVEGARVRGQTLVRVNEHYEPWDFDLAIGEGGAVTGTCTRTLPALAKPIDVKGVVDGAVEVLPDGRARYTFRLAGGGFNSRGAAADVTVYVEKSSKGELRAYAAGGHINQASFEVDPGGLKWDDKSINGPLTIIVHADRYGSVHPDRLTALAMSYDLDATVASTDGKALITGKFSGAVGVAYRKTAQVAGKYRAGADLLPYVEAAATGAVVGCSASARTVVVRTAHPTVAARANA